MDTSTVHDLGENGTLARILPHYGATATAELGPGDDCAVLRTDERTVVTTDTMIEGTDFNLSWQAPYELGWKLAATNLSDIAAMGATPTALTVAMACSPSTRVSLLEGIAEGLSAACTTLAPGCNVVGGDLSASTTMMISITALGSLGSRKPVTRTGAQPGDRIAYAGELGLAAVGLGILVRETRERDVDLSGAQLADLWSHSPVPLAAQLAPTPPIQLGIEASRAGATSMIDVSDSLSLDSLRVAGASGVSMNLQSHLLLAGFGRQLDTEVPLEVMLFGGEDHGLLATFPIGASLPHGFREIGHVGSGPAGTVTLDDAPLEHRGWDPFTQV